MSFGNSDNRWDFTHNGELVERVLNKEVPLELMEKVVDSQGEGENVLRVLGFDNKAISNYRKRVGIVKKYLDKGKAMLEDLVDDWRKS